MTIHAMQADFQLLRPDLNIVSARRAQVRRLAESLSDVYLQAKGEKLASLLGDLGHVDKQALDALNLLPAILITEGLEGLFLALAEVRQKPLSEEAAGHLDQIVQATRLQRNRMLTEVSERARALDHALGNFAAATVSDVEHLIAPVEAAVAQIDACIVTDEKPLASLIEQETAINALIGAVESVSFIDRLKPLVQSLEQLAEIDPQNTQAHAMRAGVSGVANILGLSRESLRYNDLIDARERLQRQLDGLRPSACETYARRKVEARKLEQLQQLQAIDSPKRAYTHEFGKLLEALNSFLGLNRIEAADDVEPRTAQFIEHARMLGGYLNELRRDWRS